MRLRQYVTPVIIIAALLLITAGLLNGGFRDVLQKGSLICLECLGLG